MPRVGGPSFSVGYSRAPCERSQSRNSSSLTLSKPSSNRRGRLRARPERPHPPKALPRRQFGPDLADEALPPRRLLGGRRPSRRPAKQVRLPVQPVAQGLPHPLPETGKKVP